MSSWRKPVLIPEKLSLCFPIWQQKRKITYLLILRINDITQVQKSPKHSIKWKYHNWSSLEPMRKNISEKFMFRKSYPSWWQYLKKLIACEKGGYFKAPVVNNRGKNESNVLLLAVNFYCKAVILFVEGSGYASWALKTNSKYPGTMPWTSFCVHAYTVSCWVM